MEDDFWTDPDINDFQPGFFAKLADKYIDWDEIAAAQLANTPVFGPPDNPDRFQKNSAGMQTAGAQIIRVKEHLDRWTYVKVRATFPKFGIGNEAASSPHSFIGRFNPVEIMNSEYTQTSGNVNQEEWSSHFITTDNTTLDMRQWEAPNDLMRARTDGRFHLYNCEYVQIALEFQNNATDNDKIIYYKVFWPGDERVVNPDNAMGDGQVADSDSFVNLLHDDVGQRTLETTNGMRKLWLGPNSSNGRPNIARTLIKINVKDILNTVPDIIYNTHTTNTASIIDSEIRHDLANSLHKTNAATATLRTPTVVFWAQDVSQVGVLDAVRDGTLSVFGEAEYTVRLFGRETQLAAAIQPVTS